MQKATPVYETNGKPLPRDRSYNMFLDIDGVLRVQTDRSEGDAEDWTVVVLKILQEPETEDSADEPEPETEEPEQEQEQEPADEPEQENKAPQGTSKKFKFEVN